MKDEPLDWLKGVSRSFYLSLRLLPTPMRRAAVLAYLMARATDTLADTEMVAKMDRLGILLAMEEVIRNSSGSMPRFDGYGVSDTGGQEILLLTRLPRVWDECRELPDREWGLVRKVLLTILSGQILDLERFAEAGSGRAFALRDDDELIDYTYRVAGCVGEFWTALGLLTLGESFSEVHEETLLEWGREYGMGLQLVNLLRDLPEDLAMGRCYLPAMDPSDLDELLGLHRQWCVKASQWVSGGFHYARAMSGWRLRVAGRLPADLAHGTLERMKGADWQTLSQRIKVPRREVYWRVLCAVLPW